MFSKKASFFLLSLFIGVVVFIAQNKIPFIHEHHSVVHNVPTVEAFDEIDLANLIMLKKSPYTLCIDIREKQFYDYAHVAGSVNIPSELILSEFSKKNHF